MGISGLTAKTFQNNPITPLFGVLIILMGLFAILVTPKEEDPQINVTMVDVFLSAPGLSAKEIEQQIVTPAESVMTQIVGVKHVYSTSMPGKAVITVQFKVGIKRQEALVKTWNQVMTELHWPANYGVQPPAVRARGINDVPIVSLTFWSPDDRISQSQLGQVATSVANVLQRVEGTRNIEVTGYNPYAISIDIDPAKAAAYGVDALTVINALKQFGGHSPELAIQNMNTDVIVSIGEFFHNEQDIANLVVHSKNNKLVYLRDIADINRQSQKST